MFTTPTGLVGILTLPSDPAAGDLPAVIILNSGNMHRVGAGRISVTLARRLAGQGHLVLRFDHAGVGDSLPRRDGMDVDLGRVVEITEVMTALEERFGIDAFVVYGLCSGARDAFHAAVRDDRIRGLVQIDGFAYRNLRYHLTRLARRLADLKSLGRLAGRLSGVRPPTVQTKPGGGDMFVQEWPDYPPRSAVEAGYRTLVDRGVALYVVFTGSWDEEYNYAHQFLDMYPDVCFDGLLTLLYLPRAAHTLPDPAHREAVVEGVSRWISESVAPRAETV